MRFLGFATLGGCGDGRVWVKGMSYIVR